MMMKKMKEMFTKAPAPQEHQAQGAKPANNQKQRGALSAETIARTQKDDFVLVHRPRLQQQPRPLALRGIEDLPYDFAEELKALGAKDVTSGASFTPDAARVRLPLAEQMLNAPVQAGQPSSLSATGKAPLKLDINSRQPIVTQNAHKPTKQTLQAHSEGYLARSGTMGDLDMHAASENSIISQPQAGPSAHAEAFSDLDVRVSVGSEDSLFLLEESDYESYDLVKSSTTLTKASASLLEISRV